MTAPLSLLDIDVDELFEQHGIAEIDRIHKQLQTDVEHKKEELRTMVGERYRDLLQAADTIGTMRTTGTAVVAHVDAITGTCRRLNEQQLIGFRRTGGHTPVHQPAGRPAVAIAPPATAAERALRQFHALGVQIKLLAALPELIWSRLDAEDYFVATQLFALSRHISTGLQLDAQRPLMQHFPVAGQLWAQLSPFYQAIRRACLAALGRRQLSAGTAAKCLASLLLLEQGTTVDRLLGVLMELRGRTFRDVLLDEADGRRIQEQVLSSLDVLLATVRLVHECFVDGAVRTELLQLQGADARPTIDLLTQSGTVDATLAQRLPDIIATYRPRVHLTELQPESMRSATTGWLHFTAVDCKRHIQSVIDGIASVQTVQRIREQSLAVEKPPNWPQMLADLHLPADWDLYRSYFQPLINERVQQIVRRSWQSISAGTLANVERLAQQTERTDAEPKDADKWRPNGGAVPLSLKQALSADRRQHPMLLAERGYAPPIVAVCAELDEQLQSIYDDLTLYLGDPAATAGPGDPEAGEHALLVAYLQATSREAVAELIVAIQSMTGHRSKSTCVALATLLPAIVELCPNLKRCLQQGGSTRPATASTPPSDWTTVTGLLADASFAFWSEWIEAFVAEQAARLPAAAQIDYRHMAGDQLLWERIRVEETDEQERPIESTIRVPAHVSVGLQQFWHTVSTQLQAQLVPYTLPARVMAALVAALTEHVRTVYAARAAQPFVRASQTASLQCYFDVRFVQLVFVGRTAAGGGRTDEWAELAGAFKANVDPFDFELFHRYVGANVKKAALRMQHKLGVLIANVDQLTGVLAAGQPPAATAHDKEPNVLTLSTAKNETTGYFSLLPVMSAPPISSSGVQPAKSVPVTEPTNSKAKRTKAPTNAATSVPANAAQSNAATAGGARADNLANVKSGAAAFFGAMSKDWFQ